VGASGEPVSAVASRSGGQASNPFGCVSAVVPKKSSTELPLRSQGAPKRVCCFLAGPQKGHLTCNDTSFMVPSLCGRFQRGHVSYATSRARSLPVSFA